MAYKYKLVKEIKPAELEKDLGDIGIEQNKIDQILDLWAERAQLMHMNEIDNLNPVLNKIKPTDLDTDLEQEKINKTKGNTYMTPEEHEERKKQGKKNLTKEVLRRLKNR